MLSGVLRTELATRYCLQNIPKLHPGKHRKTTEHIEILLANVAVVALLMGKRDNCLKKRHSL